MIPLDEARSIVKQAMLARKPASSERLPLREAAGRVLAVDVASCLDMPPFDRATMDGYAVCEGEIGRRLRVVAEVQAGQETSVPLLPGTAIKIMTGAPAPAGTGRVVMVEKTRREGEHVEILTDDPSRNVAPRGEDLAAGDLIARTGQRLDGVRIASLIACGVETVEVARRPRIEILVTGDELVARASERTGGRILDANSPLLHGLLQAHGYRCGVGPFVPDDPDVTKDRIAKALADSDMVVLTGGVSAGDYDYVPGALRDLGCKILFSRVAVKPGKPVTFAVSNDSSPGAVVFGLPGNPVSVFVAAHLFVLPALAALEGADRHDRTIRLPLAQAWRQRTSPRVRFLPARLDGEGRVSPLPYHGSGHLHSLAAADGLIRLESGVTELAAGTLLPFWPVRLSAYDNEAG